MEKEKTSTVVVIEITGPAIDPDELLRKLEFVISEIAPGAELSIERRPSING